MDIGSYWHLFLESSGLACFVAEKESGNIVYYNQKMEPLFRDDMDIVGSPFYQVVEADTIAFTDWAKINWGEQEIVRDKIFSKKSNQVFTVDLIHTQYVGISYIYGRFVPVQTTKHFNFSFEEMMSQCISISQGEESNRIPLLLETLGEFYNAEKTFLYSIDRKEMSISALHIWTKENGEGTQSVFLSTMECKKLLLWFKDRDKQGVIQATKNHLSFCELSLESEVLAALDINNIVLNTIENGNQEVFAFVGMTDRANLLEDFRLLHGVTGFIETGLSKTELQQNQTHWSERDMLTGCYSRHKFSEKMIQISQDPPHSLGIIYANSNGLKMVNDELGQEEGDSYLKKVAESLKNHFPCSFYRTSGDEFVTFWTSVEKSHFESQISTLLEKMQQEEDRSFALGHSWGQGRFQVEALMKEADAMMYINKQEFYASTQNLASHTTDRSLSDLFRYLENDEFMVYLQAQVYLEDGSLYGAEALIRRMDTTNQKMVFPDQFIPFYEKKSLIRHIDLFVVEEVCRLLQEWKEKDSLMPISVNLSRVTLQEFGIVKTIAGICDKYDVPRKYVVIEVTERVGLVENNVASTLIQDFKKYGFHISLDDFGCAYSNIVTLAQIDVDEVKIDKSLIDNLTIHEKNRVLVKNVLTMCNELKDTTTLAEGIETAEQGLLLHQLGCQLGQGYFYARPIPVSEFYERFIKNRNI